MLRPPRTVRWPGAVDQALALGQRLVPRSSERVVTMPGSHVWDGWDHVLVRGVWLRTRPAWGRGEEPLVTLPERESFDAIAGERESFDPC